MIAGTDRGLLLTCLWYIREVDPQTLLLTGLTRDGVYLVENGEVTGAVNNFRFNESPVAMLGRITEVGRHGPALSREWGDVLHPHGDAAAAGRRLQHVLGEPGQLGRIPAGHPARSASSSRKPTLSPTWKCATSPVHDLAADLGDLEPVQVPQGLPGPVQGVADGGLDPLGRGARRSR